MCVDCGNLLTEEEREWLAPRCENCERIWFARVEAWRRGARDQQLDAMYGGATVH